MRIYPGHKVDIAQDATDLMHDSRGTRTKKLFRRQQRDWDSSRSDKPIVHKSVSVRMSAGPELPHNVAYRPWVAELDHDIEPWNDPAP